MEAISSNEYYWGNTAIVVVEDDAQNGPDHVDSHRSPAYVISPYTRGRGLDPAIVRRFLEEAQATAQLEHPGIVPVYDIGADTLGREYMTVPPARGRSRAARVRGFEGVRK